MNHDLSTHDECQQPYTLCHACYMCVTAVQVMWLLSAKVSEDIFRKQLERLVGAVANHMQQGNSR